MSKKSLNLCEVFLALVTDKQESICLAVERQLSGVPHQLCHYHYKDLSGDCRFCQLTKLPSPYSTKRSVWIRQIAHRLDGEGSGAKAEHNLLDYLAQRTQGNDCSPEGMGGTLREDYSVISVVSNAVNAGGFVVTFQPTCLVWNSDG